eukprot:scaffold119899_cov14-Tisochrysis_lutea.AAC.1
MGQVPDVTFVERMPSCHLAILVVEWAQELFDPMPFCRILPYLAELTEPMLYILAAIAERLSKPPHARSSQVVILGPRQILEGKCSLYLCQVCGKFERQLLLTTFLAGNAQGFRIGEKQLKRVCSESGVREDSMGLIVSQIFQRYADE